MTFTLPVFTKLKITEWRDMVILSNFTTTIYEMWAVLVEIYLRQ
jgi:hypothetical protein